MSLKIHFKILGKKKPYFAFEDFTYPENQTSLRDLLVFIVTDQVGQFNQRIQNTNPFQELIAQKIEDGQNTGKIKLSSFSHKIAGIDKAVEAVFLAFKDGLFYVFINDEQILDLDAQLNIENDSQILFLKLTFLSGSYFY